MYVVKEQEQIGIQHNLEGKPSQATVMIVESQKQQISSLADRYRWIPEMTQSVISKPFKENREKKYVYRNRLNLNAQDSMNSNRAIYRFALKLSLFLFENIFGIYNL